MRSLSLALLLLVFSGCVELAFLWGSSGKTTTQDAGATSDAPDAGAQFQHVHCGENTVFCWNSDGHCCKVCGGTCP